MKCLTWEQLGQMKRAAFRRPKYQRVELLTDPDGRKWKFIGSRGYWAQITYAPSTAPKYKNSKTMCENRNKRSKSFGYTHSFSMRERGWPT